MLLPRGSMARLSGLARCCRLVGNGGAVLKHAPQWAVCGYSVLCKGVPQSCQCPPTHCLCADRERSTGSMMRIVTETRMIRTQQSNDDTKLPFFPNLMVSFLGYSNWRLLLEGGITLPWPWPLIGCAYSSIWSHTHENMRSDNLLIGLSVFFQKKKIKDMRLGGECVRGRVAGSGEEVWLRCMCTYGYMKNLKEVKETSLMSLKFYIICSLQETLLLLPLWMIDMWLHTHPQHSVLFAFKNKCMSFQICVLYMCGFHTHECYRCTCPCMLGIKRPE